MAPSKLTCGLEDSDSRLVDAAWQQFVRSSQGSRYELRPTHSAADSDTYPGPPSDSFTGYRILHTIHRGGQGVVYQAVQESTGRKVAIKVMREGPFSSPSEQARFDREVRILGQLRHPNIVAIHDTGIAAGWHYFVMDHIDGKPLDEHSASGHRTVNQTLALFRCICEALNAAHLRGIIHRDLKPANILVDAEGQPHVLDFGLAKVASTTDRASLMTRTGQFIGSMPWASPEQCSGRPAEVDVRTDVYSLGVILFQMLTGRFPYWVFGDLREVMERIQTAEPLRPRSLRREIDDEVETIVLKCLQKDPERRYQSAGELARDVGHYLAGKPIEAKRDSVGYVLRKHMIRHRLPLAIGMAFVLVLSVSSAVAWTLYASASLARAEATESLWESYLTQVRSGAASRSVGRRFESLVTAKKAADIRPVLELRDAATACLALSDLRVERSFGSSPWAVSDGMRRADRYAFMPQPGEVVVRSLETGQDLARLTAPPLTMYEGTFSPDGRYFGAKFHHADDHDNIYMRVWDIDNPEPLLQFGPCKGWGSGKAAFGTPPGAQSWVAITQEPNKIHVYQLPTGKPLTTLRTNGFQVWMAGSPDGRKLAVSLAEPEGVEIWDVETSQLLLTLQNDMLSFGLAWSPDGQFLAVASEDTLVHVWDLHTATRVVKLRGHSRAVIRVSFDSSGTKLASTSWDGTTRLWDWRAGELLMDPLRERRMLSFDERLVLVPPSTPQLDQPIELLSFVEALAPRRFECEAAFGNSSLSVEGDGRRFLTAGFNGVRLWDSASMRQLAQISSEPALSSRLLPDRSAVFFAGYSGLESASLNEGTDDDIVVGPAESVLAGTGMRRVGLSADGQIAVVSGGDLVVLEVHSREVTRRLPGFRGMTHPSISPDTRWIFVGAWKGEAARLYDLRSESVIRKFPGKSVTGTFSPNGAWLVVCNGPEYVFLETGTWEQRYRLPRDHRYGSAASMAFSADSSLFAMLRTTEVPCLIDAPTGRRLLTLPNPDGKTIDALAFVSRPESLVGLTTGNEILVWDISLIRAELRDLGLDWERIVN